MKCPHCNYDHKGLVLESRVVGDDILRRRGCPDCGRTYVTREYPDKTLKIPCKKAPVKVRAKSRANALTGADVSLFGVWGGK